ncbi:hypothetical protein [Photobacterium leiognathi]|uniref:hypothetical protein n=1 Tax=Photobacterium leiognathi TaxID=553611 RepID=UPI002982B2C1|nr:hypothetical protein [Photobacterium leiognathi]
MNTLNNNNTLILIKLSNHVRPLNMHCSLEEAQTTYNSDKFVYKDHKVEFLGDVSMEEAQKRADVYNEELKETQEKLSKRLAAELEATRKNTPKAHAGDF